MNRTRLTFFFATLLIAATALAQVRLPTLVRTFEPGNTKPILVSMSGLTGEAATTLQFDLYVQGFAFTNAEAAQYLITGSNNGNLQAKATDSQNKSTLVSKSYSGASLRRQVHAFADDFVAALGGKGIAQTKFACKGEKGSNSEIYLADFDGHNPQPVTQDNSLVAAPCWVPGHLALYYVSYKLNHADIFYHDLSTGARRAFARFGGSNMSPAASAGTTQIWNPDRYCAVNAIHFPSGDQSGSVGLGMPLVPIRCGAPPEGDTLHNVRRSLSFAAKQIHCPSGDQQGEDSSCGDRVSRLRPLPSASETYKSVQPSLLRIMAILLPPGEAAGLMFDPPNRAKALRAPEERS